MTTRAFQYCIGLAGLVVMFWSTASAIPSKAVWPRWERYKSHFVTSDYRVVDWSAEQRTTSEGQAYALFFALVANDRNSFDRILDWTEQHLGQGDLRQHLPSWLWQRGANGEWGVQDPNSAADADLWIAYTLVEAGKAWRDPSYTAKGQAVAERIAREEVFLLSGEGPVLLPGRSGFHVKEGSFVFNPSYLPLQLLTALAQDLPHGPWAEMAKALPKLLSWKVGHGFAMDWVGYETSIGFFPSEPVGGSYDAIRVYLWAGMLHPDTPGRKALLSSLSGMSRYLESHSVPPERVDADGKVIGLKGPAGFSAALIPFLIAVGEQGATNQQQARLRDISNSPEIKQVEADYYYHNLTLFAQGWSEDRFRFDVKGHLILRWIKV